MANFIKNARFFLVPLTILAALIAGFGLLKEVSAKDSDERLRLVHADWLQGETVDGRTLQRLEGDILFRQGDASMSCDRALRDVDRGVVVFMDNVLIDTGKRQLRADRVAYNERTRVEEASGHVVIYDSTRTLKGDRVTYLANEEKAFADGNVTLEDTARFATLTCGHMEYQRLNGYALAQLAPCLAKTDSTGSDTIQIRGQKMEIFDSGKRAVVSDSVHITRRPLNATCGLAEYLDDEQKIILTIQPRATRKLEKLFGQRFELLLDETEIDTVVILGDALITSPVDSLNPGKRINRLSGQKVTMSVRNEYVDEIIIEDQGISFYHIVEDGEFRGINYITGDIIKLFLADDELKRVRIKSSPGKTGGTYFPPRLEQLANPSKIKQ